MNDSTNPIYLSSGAFTNNLWKQIHNVASECGLHNIELGPGAVCKDQDFDHIALLQKQGWNFLVHNYFPPPPNPFVLNLASNDPLLLERCRSFCIDAITLAERFHSQYYSVHAGFCFHAKPEHLGHNLTDLNVFPIDEAEEIFVQSIQILSDFAQSKGITLLIENNVLSPNNLIQRQNKLLLAVTADDINRIYKKINRKNVRLLLDVGHLNVSANSLNFDKFDFFQEVLPLIEYVHLSHNDGTRDNNQPMSPDNWFWSPLKMLEPQKTTWVIEVYKISPDTMKQQIQLVESSLF